MSRRIGWIVALALVIGVLALSTEEINAVTIHGRFTDDDGHPLENGIEAIAAERVTQGCNPPANDEYCPDRLVTRAEAAAFIARALDLPDASRDYFTDDNGHPNEPAINKIAEAGITSGCNAPASTLFCPNRRLTRAEFAAFAARAFKLPDSEKNWFTDDDGHVLEPAINKMAAARITIGCNPPANTRFCPNRLLTRAQTAAFLKRGLNLPVPGIPLRMSNWDQISCNKQLTRCRLEVTVAAGTTYRIDEGVFQVRPYQPGEEAAFTASSTRFELSLDGSPVVLTESPVDIEAAQAVRMWGDHITFDQGAHTLIAQWRWEGSEVMRTTVQLQAN